MTSEARRQVRYRETAAKLGIPLPQYLAQGEAGKQYCIRCQVWKDRRQFLQYAKTTTSFTGTCKKCRGYPRKPAGIPGREWGPALAAARRLNMDPRDYIAKRKEGQRWCTDHKAWFDASKKLESPTYSGARIIRCNPCQVRREQDKRNKKRGIPVTREEE